MIEPAAAADKPVLVALESRPYFWCACGRSKTQPFCDGSHSGTPFKPLKFTPELGGGEALLCACKRTRRPPYCDGSHNQLKNTYREASEDEIRATASAQLAVRSEGAYGRASLDGGAFVLTPKPQTAAYRGGWRMTPMIDRAAGARHLSQYAVEVIPGAPPLRFGSELVLFFRDSLVEIVIAGRAFAVGRESAVCVRRGEPFAVRSLDGAPVSAVATACSNEAFEILEGMTGDFSAAAPDRVGHSDAALRQAMGDRYYQVLIDETRGAGGITQFIGEIPKSRAAAHRHLYEEALLVLSGEGFLWTESVKAEVRAGDVIFLPMKQLHSLECTSDAGMRLAGAFYPSGSPAINY